MNGFNFTQWLTIVGPIAILTSFMFYLIREDMYLLGLDMKQIETRRKVDVNHMFNLWKENQDRWMECSMSIKDCNLRIEQILVRMEKQEK